MTPAMIGAAALVPPTVITESRSAGNAAKVAAGVSDDVIGRRLGISPRTELAALTT
jgi:hypothetical protein